MLLNEKRMTLSHHPPRGELDSPPHPSTRSLRAETPTPALDIERD
jgi:hypothetical protein